MARKTIHCYLLIVALEQLGMSFFMATYVVFLRARGLDLLQTNLVNLAFFITMFACEIPTGAIADVFGRKTSYLISCGIMIISLLIYGSAETFWCFITAEILGAIAHTFASGAFQAWLVDRVRNQGYAESLVPIFSWEQRLRYAINVVGAISGSWLASGNDRLPWYLGAIAFGLAGLTALIFMREDWHKTSQITLSEAYRDLWQTIKTSFKLIRQITAIRLAFTLGITMFFAFMAPNMQWQVVFKPLMGTRGLGIIFSINMLIMLIGSLTAPVLARRFNMWPALCLTQIVTGLAIATSLLFQPLVGFCLFQIHEFGRGAFKPIKDAFVNDKIPSGQRATMLSCESIAHHLGGAIGLLVSGLMAQLFSITSAWLFTGLILAAVATVLMSKKDY